MNFLEITNQYYAKWLDVEPKIMNTKEIVFVESSERDKQQPGYSNPFGVYAYITNNLIIISYSKKFTDKIRKIKNEVNLGMTAKEIKNIMENVFNTNVSSHIKFCYDELISNIDTTNVIKLFDTDYSKYLEFFNAQNPNAKVDGWLQDYFNDICKKGLCFGIFHDNKLVSVTDAPDMPYMEEMVQEIGINTLTEFRGRAYAKSVTLESIKAILDKGKCPQWSCSNGNIASEKLAYSVGFRKLAEVLIISISGEAKMKYALAVNRVTENEEVCFGHSLYDLIQGQIDVGFLITGFYEDVGGSPLDKYIPTFFATKAIKL